jgi:hypothetical protein
MIHANVYLYAKLNANAHPLAASGPSVGLRWRGNQMQDGGIQEDDEARTFELVMSVVGFVLED